MTLACSVACRRFPIGIMFDASPSDCRFFVSPAGSAVGRILYRLAVRQTNSERVDLGQFSISSS
jgi:hypothetical protein